jgi:hypothetical protein
MTATEAIRKLKERGLPDEHAESIVDVIETWHAERAVTRDYLDAKLDFTRDHLDAKLGQLSSDLRAWMESKLRAQLWQIGSLILVATVLNHFWR